MKDSKNIKHDISVLEGIRKQCDEHFAKPKSDEWFSEFDIAENMFYDTEVFNKLAKYLGEFADSTIAELEQQIEEA